MRQGKIIKAFRTITLIGLVCSSMLLMECSTFLSQERSNQENTHCSQLVHHQVEDKYPHFAHRGLDPSVAKIRRLILPDDQFVKRLIASLDSDYYNEREEAYKELILSDSLMRHLSGPTVFHKLSVNVRNHIEKALKIPFYPDGQGFLIDCARFLGHSKDSLAIEPLLAMLSHRDPYVALHAASALSNLRYSSKVKQVITKLKETSATHRIDAFLAGLKCSLASGDIQMQDVPYGQWPRVRNDLRNTGSCKYVGPDSPCKLWEFDTNVDTRRTPPVVGLDGTVYVSLSRHGLVALNPNGTKKWVFEKEYFPCFPPALGKMGTIYFAPKGGIEEKGLLHAVAPDGTEMWRCAVGSGETEQYVRYASPPWVGEDGSVYLLLLWEKFCKIDPFGKKKWCIDVSSPGGPVPVSDISDILYLPLDQNLCAVATDGKILWTKKGIGYDMSISLSSDGVAYLTGFGGDVMAVDLKKKETIWKLPALGTITASVGIGHDGRLYVTARAGRLRAVSTDGKTMWDLRFAGEYLTAPIIDKRNRVYFGSDDGNLYAVDPSGTLVWKYPIGSKSRMSSPAMSADGRIYVCSGTKVYAIGEK